MKTPIAVTLIICGTVLIALPCVSAAGAVKQLALAMSTLGNGVGSAPVVSPYADIAYVTGGIVMILAGVIGSVISERKRGE